MEIPFNPDWVVQDKQEMSNLVEQGTDLIAGGNEDLKSVLKSSQISTAYLLTVFKHEIGAPVEYNPSLVVVAENNNNFPGIKNGRDYLFHVKKLMKQTQIEYLFEKDVFEKTIGSSSGHILEIKVEQFGTTIIQEYIATLKKGFNVSFIISYTTEEEKNELYEIIDNIKL